MGALGSDSVIASAAQAPNACGRVLRWDELAGRMFDLGMLELLEAAQTPMIVGRPAVAELFGVLKRGTDQRRVIFDRRRRKATEKSLPGSSRSFWPLERLRTRSILQLMRLVTLPHRSQLAAIVAAPGESLSSSHRRTSPSSIAASLGRRRGGTRMPSARSSGRPSSRPLRRTRPGGATLSKLRG